MRILTLAQLIEAGACVEQVKLFKECFKKSVVVTKALAVSLSHVFDLDWAATNLLSNRAKAKYDKVCKPAWGEYGEVHDAAQVKHWKAREVAWAKYTKVRVAAYAEYAKKHTSYAEYCKVCAAAYVEYEKVCDAAQDEYWKLRDAAWDEFKKVCAVTFAKLYNADQT